MRRPARGEDPHGDTSTYRIYDVFTDASLAGNPLAIVEGGEGLDTEAMQRVAREFNLSETVFVAPPSKPHHSAPCASSRPGHELPFAGHPTVGTAIALARRGLSG